MTFDTIAKQLWCDRWLYFRVGFYIGATLAIIFGVFR